MAIATAAEVQRVVTTKQQGWCVICGVPLVTHLRVETGVTHKTFHLVLVCNDCRPLLLKGTLADPAMKRR